MNKLALSLVTASLLAAGAIVLAPSAAFAGTAEGAGLLVNGQAAPAGKPVTLKANDSLTAGEKGAVIKTAAGDEIRLDKGATVRFDGVQDGVEFYVVQSGSATASLSTKSTLGTSAAWATAPEGMRTEVRVEASGGEGRFRTVTGGTWLRSGSEKEYAIWLADGNSATLWRDAKTSSLCFRTSQQNNGSVEMRREVSGGTITVMIPRAATGCITPLSGNKTKIANDLNSNKQEKLGISTAFGSASSVQVAPGGFAVVDNQTGKIEVTEEIIDDSLGEELPSFDAVENAADASISTRTKR